MKTADGIELCDLCCELVNIGPKHHCRITGMHDDSRRIADSLERIADALERINKREDALRRVRKAPSDDALLDAALSARL